MTDQLDRCPTCLRPYAEDRRYHAARNGDPESSHAAVRIRAPGWGTMNGIALRIHAAHPDGLSHWEVQQIAEGHLGQGALGKSPWKRIGELWTDFAPALIAPVLNPHGTVVTVPGEFNDPVDLFQITSDGVAMWRRMRRPQ